MIHPHTELQFINREIGYGVVATQFIPKGTIVWVLDILDQEFTPDQVVEMDDIHKQIIETYAFRNNQGNYALCWDHGRYVNHSFKPSCMSTAYDFEVAIRDIQIGEQLTDDYGYLNISEPFHAYDEHTRRKTVYPDDILRHYKTWDKNVLDVIHLAPGLDQPLRSVLPDRVWDTILRVVKGEEEMKSILTCYYDPHRRDPKAGNPLLAE